MEDKLLLWRLSRGSTDALKRIYDKYESYMLRLAAGLLNNIGDAEDAVHDVFVTFARSVGTINIHGSLKSYLASSVLNRSRDMIRMAHSRRTVDLDNVSEPASGDIERPDMSAICAEESRRMHRLLGRIPIEQREVIVLHLNGEMTFRQIAAMQETSINTIQSRYRYGLDKLRSLLSSEVQDETN